LENCWQCLELENVRLAKIKRWAELLDQCQDRGKTPASDLDASIEAAVAEINEAWKRLAEHRKSHNRTEHG